MFRACPVRGFVSLLLLGVVSRSALGGFASAVVNYVPGDVPASLQNATSALGSPAADTTFGVLTPFNAAFDSSQIMGIGPGGSLVLQLATPAATGAGRTLGVHAAVGLIDNDYPNGSAGAVAAAYTNPRLASVFVSDDNARWFSLGHLTFALPTNYYSQGVTTPGYQPEPGTEVAEFSKPFVATLPDFNGMNWPSILALLDNSAGGTWLDLTSVAFATVNYVRFDVTEPGERMIIDAVVVVPEPLAGAIMGVAMLLPRRR
jgi:hypothetical protein